MKTKLLVLKDNISYSISEADARKIIWAKMKKREECVWDSGKKYLDLKQMLCVVDDPYKPSKDSKIEGFSEK